MKPEETTTLSLPQILPAPGVTLFLLEGADGIDSSLIFFDDDGSLWYAGNFISEEKLYEGHHGIYLNELDPVTFQF